MYNPSPDIAVDGLVCGNVCESHGLDVTSGLVLRGLSGPWVAISAELFCSCTLSGVP